jgi:anaerobic magnesium-protoporphyrin IX monomethyl ester cyclase
MKILLTHGYFLEEDAKERQIMKPYPPLGLLYVSAFLEAGGFPNEVFDSTFASFAQLTSHLEEMQPDLIGVYVNLMTRPNVLRLIRHIRQHPHLREAYIVLGGPEVRHHRDRLLQAGADAIVLGEGEETTLELARRLQRSGARAMRQGAAAGLAGAAVVDAAGAVTEGAARPLRKDLDSLPLPARDKIDLDRYFVAWKSRHGESAVSVSTMRGCPYTCRWCSRAVYGQSYRRRSPAAVADELEALQRKYTFDTVWFVDDVFTVSHRWLKAFRDEVLRRRLVIRYECITRSDRLDAVSLQWLKESGCFRVWIGAESGSQNVIDAMDRRVDVQQVRDMIRAAREQGLQAGTFIMLGYPGETEHDIEATIRHLVESDPDLYTITVAYPIRGTPLFEEVEGRLLQQLPWETATDRDLDFRRTYPRRYYDYALRRLYNEVAYHKAIKNPASGYWRRTTFKLKSLAAKGGMTMVRWMGRGG